MKHITTLAEYCREINIAPPRHGFFDIRRFEDNMKTVNKKQAPFRHEFYAVALRHEGRGRELMGKAIDTKLFFNSPYQVVTWDIAPDWKGWYIIFDKEFISMNRSWENFIIDHPFFRLDQYLAFDLPDEAFEEANGWFSKIFEEYHSDNPDKFQFIQTYTQLLLHTTKRYFDRSRLDTQLPENNRTADILLVSRFQALIETMATQEDANPGVRQPSFYAGMLNIHPNHLNAVVKRITDKTASQLIQQHLITYAKSLLRQTDLTAKEIAYRLHFTEPTHFNAFFRKQTGITPQAFRDGK
ncbi:MAG: helix-turn-helix domain-containing protein [Bacteroidia bacterium]|nr:helix-turn-helix domain-containing protein [Bacteroidia bacterium]